MENSLVYLAVQQVDEMSHFLDHFVDLGLRRVVVLLGNSAEPPEVVLIQLQVCVQLSECGLQLETKQTYFRDLAWVWQDVAVRTETDWPLSPSHTHTHIQTYVDSHPQMRYRSITSRLLRSLAVLLLISGRDLNLWGSTSESNAPSF